MTTNNDVGEYLDYYLDPKLETDFAVMLNGPWGAGKTHFIKIYLKDREDKARSADPLQPLGHLYASLYAASIHDLKERFDFVDCPSHGAAE
jgi:tRNA A37 threonylcarbamoyladenosine biosynthesis protein TsaE